MKNTWKKYAAVAMAGVLSAGMLTGCGDKKEEAAFDGTKTVATVNGEEIPLGLLSFVVRNEQAYMRAMYEAYGLGQYLSNLYDGPVSEDSEMTYGEQTRNEVLDQVEMMYVIRSKAADYGVEVTAEDQEKIAAAAAAFMEANDEETIAALGVTEDIMKTYLELETYFTRTQDPIKAEADHEVSDEQAQMSSFSYIHIAVEEPEAEEVEDEDAVIAEDEEVVEDTEAVEESVESDDAEESEEPAESDDAEAAEETAESDDAEEQAEPTEAELKAKANVEAFYEALSADPEADMTELVKSIDDSLYSYNGTFQTNLSDEWEDATASYYNEDMIAALRELKEGEITAIIETEDDGYYVARLEKEFDEDATERQRESIISDRESTYYSETTQAWLEEAEVSVVDEVLNTLKVTDSAIFTTVSNSGDAEEEELVEEEEVAEEVVDEDAAAAEEVEEDAEAAVEEAAEEVVEEAAEEETEEK